MRRLFLLFSTLVLLLCTGIAHAAIQAAAGGNGNSAGKRIALVIGNAAYPQPLLNPVNDARAMAERLRRLGFEVLLRTDINGAQLQKASAEFSTLARGADIALVFYAGHGAQAGEANYVLPIGANMNALSAAAIAAQGVSVSSLAGDLQRTGARGAVLILDACRQEYTRGGDLVALTALGYGIGGGDAGIKQPKAGMQWLEKAAAKDFPIAQTYLAELLMVKGDPASLKRAGVLLDAASQAGYSPAHAYKFDLARRTGAAPQDAARHLQDAFMGLMKDYQGAAKDVLQPPKK